jgi:S1-C subfamily serine protease
MNMSERGNIALIAIGVLAATALVVIGASAISSRLATISGSVDELTSRVGTLEEKLGAAIADANALRATLSEEEQNRLTQEEARQKEQAELAAQLETLSTDVSGQTLLLKASDLSAVIARWKPYVYKISCTFRSGTEDEETNGASAVTEVKSGTTWFVTNGHVLEDQGDYPDSCRLLVPGTETNIKVSNNSITVESDESDRDIGYGTITTAGVPGVSPMQHCSGKPELGDAVVILGYPTIGGKESVTATEGIISGFDDTYYTTSAKIEKGNSGGAAIDVKRDCLLGLPTLVVAGRVESLARILPFP